MDIELLITLATYPIVIATLVVYGMQARHMGRQTTTLAASHNALIYQSLATQMIDIDRLFIERPYLRPYFYGGSPVPAEEPLRSEVESAAELFIDFVDSYVVVQEVACGPDARLREALDLWVRYFRDIAGSSPAIQRVWSSERQWFGTAVRDILDGACGKNDDDLE